MKVYAHFHFLILRKYFNLISQYECKYPIFNPTLHHNLPNGELNFSDISFSYSCFVFIIVDTFLSLCMC